MSTTTLPIEVLLPPVPMTGGSDAVLPNGSSGTEASHPMDDAFALLLGAALNLQVQQDRALLVDLAIPENSTVEVDAEALQAVDEEADVRVEWPTVNGNRVILGSTEATAEGTAAAQPGRGDLTGAFVEAISLQRGEDGASVPPPEGAETAFVSVSGADNSSQQQTLLHSTHTTQEHALTRQDAQPPVSQQSVAGPEEPTVVTGRSVADLRVLVAEDPNARMTFVISNNQSGSKPTPLADLVTAQLNADPLTLSTQPLSPPPVKATSDSQLHTQRVDSQRASLQLVSILDRPAEDTTIGRDIHSTLPELVSEADGLKLHRLLKLGVLDPTQSRTMTEEAPISASMIAPPEQTTYTTVQPDVSQDNVTANQKSVAIGKPVLSQMAIEEHMSSDAAVQHASTPNSHVAPSMTSHSHAQSLPLASELAAGSSPNATGPIHFEIESPKPMTVPGQITVHLNPPELGRVRIDLYRHDDGVIGRMRIHSHSVRTLVERDMPELYRTLSEAGIRIERLEITAPGHAPEPHMLTSQENSHDMQQHMSQSQDRAAGQRARQGMTGEPRMPADSDTPVPRWQHAQFANPTFGVGQLNLLA